MKTRLQALRKEAGYKSAVAFAKEINMNPHTYTEYEQGRITMSLQQAYEFADILDCTLDALAGREGPEIYYDDSEQEALNYLYEKMTYEGKRALVAAARGIHDAFGWDPENNVIPDYIREQLDEERAIDLYDLGR